MKGFLLILVLAAGFSCASTCDTGNGRCVWNCKPCQVDATVVPASTPDAGPSLH
jgi:hypothetical protein